LIFDFNFFFLKQGDKKKKEKRKKKKERRKQRSFSLGPPRDAGKNLKSVLL